MFFFVNTVKKYGKCMIPNKDLEVKNDVRI